MIAWDAITSQLQSPTFWCNLLLGFGRARRFEADISGTQATARGPSWHCLSFEDDDSELKEVDLGVQRLSIYPLIHVTRALALAGPGKLAEAKEAMTRAVELGQGAGEAPRMT